MCLVSINIWFHSVIKISGSKSEPRSMPYTFFYFKVSEHATVDQINYMKINTLSLDNLIKYAIKSV